MSVLIKGMEMQYRGCNECFLRHGNLCSRTKNSVVYYARTDSFDPDCPLVEVPTLHGRLIDADAFEKKLQHLVMSEEPYQRGIGKAVLLAVKCEPTIIEAEAVKE